MPEEFGQVLGGDLSEDVGQAHVALLGRAVLVALREGEHDAGDALAGLLVTEAEPSSDAVHCVEVAEKGRRWYSAVGAFGGGDLPLDERLPAQPGVGLPAVGHEGTLGQGGLESRRPYGDQQVPVGGEPCAAVANPANRHGWHCRILKGCRWYRTAQRFCEN
ncbi:hypothetical protein [Streptomyces sp. NPDC002221]|uniref:hypothetical protein n=1 Tax=Streptomyces sp. NPDC002221 TaxID=3364639 RepID=UPI0036B0D308